MKKKLLLILILLLIPCSSSAEFYKYVDKDGKIFFVDDPAKIPQKYSNLKVYKEKYDNLPDNEKAENIEKDRRQEFQRQQTERAEEAKLAREQTVTKVSIQGNHVLIPATLGYEGKETDVLLVLDTGASVTALHDDIAKRLYVYDTQKSQAQVAGGKIIDTEVITLSYIKVGPYKKQDIQALIINYEGMTDTYDGLLGMNFLRGLEYSIDFENQTIRWK